ncbi:MAG: phosphate regulon transcriptional regulator PhoB [Gammaproteobacteria bacterium]|nr:phosphate regulon transcriptional regulator PhoB [Gammaproteobacteria bacterium]MBT8443472.1 phosphate regulon transcriptional regulator PhoB [Gammaproteobacteria bacterium]NND36968.1 phosphate regulon transcriptional regulator PhoB [Gammaproteobacteria bacterium]
MTDSVTARRILIVEDEAPIRQMLAFNLKRAGFDVDEAEDCSTARRRIADLRPDLVLVDWMLPDTSGLELTRSLRREDINRDLPIIMLTAKAAEREKIIGLEGGADDYVTKPFSPKELIARIHALLRRSAPSGDSALQAGALRLDPVSHRVLIGDDEINLGPTEFRLLRFMMQNPDRVYSRGQLLDYVWGQNVYVEERTVDVHVRRLRKALEDADVDKYVQTVRGAGYRFSVR